MISGRVTRFTPRSSSWAGSSLPSAAAISALAIATVCFTGCGDDKKPNEPTPPPAKHYPAPVSPDSVIAAFEQAYIAKDIEEYSTLFDHVLFTFAFAQVDRDQNPDLDPTWGWGAESESADRIFESTIVYAIRCNLSARDAAAPATEADQLGFSLEDLANTKRVRIREARVEIDTKDEGGGPLVLNVDGDVQEFFIKVYPDELIDGEPRHRIVYWKDKAIATGGGGDFARGVVGAWMTRDLATDATTWGAIKNLFER